MTFDRLQKWCEFSIFLKISVPLFTDFVTPQKMKSILLKTG